MSYNYNYCQAYSSNYIKKFFKDKKRKFRMCFK